MHKIDFITALDTFLDIQFSLDSLLTGYKGIRSTNAWYYMLCKFILRQNSELCAEKRSKILYIQ